jgi:predicted DNA-binding protein YlxM (UPF0122 family)
MIINAFEIPEIVKKCNEKNWNFNFNTVLKPWNQALWSLDSNEIVKIIDFYNSCDLNITDEIAENNNNKFQALISLLVSWNDKVKRFNNNHLNLLKREAIRTEMLFVLSEALRKSEGNYTEKINLVVDGIPDILIRNEFLDYLKRISVKMLINEFEENDIDTIIDHMCIVAFNI